MLLAAPVLIIAGVIMRARVVIVFIFFVVAAPDRMFDLHFCLNFILYFL